VLVGSPANDKESRVVSTSADKSGLVG